MYSTPACLARVDLGWSDGPGGVADVGLAAAEFLKAAAGSRDADRRGSHVRMGFAELLGDRLGNRKHRAGPVDGNQRLGGAASPS